MDIDEGIGESAGESMYVFEGTDYSKEQTADDERALEKILEGKPNPRDFISIHCITLMLRHFE